MPRPISQLASAYPQGLPGLVGILCDVDDTLTWEGKMIPGALAALQQAQQSGLRVVPITGRPAGWVDYFARMWPVDGVVGENGGLWFWMEDGRLERRYQQSLADRQANLAKLEGVKAAILSSVPGSAVASDQDYRALDLAIDFCEDVPPLGEAGIDQIVAGFEAAGATCKVSSIHVNGWFGDFDKLEGFRRFHQDRWGEEMDPSAWVYFGDSANDEPMFEALGLTVGVANVARFLPRLTHPPAWITTEPGGHGFVEGLAAIQAVRAQHNR